MMMKFPNVTFLFLIFIEYVIGDDGPIVDIPQGSLQGVHQTSYGGRVYSAFEGIPYAEPPIDDLRFVEPQPAGKWDGIMVANKTYMCMCFVPMHLLQGVRGTEDCLYLYVYVPREKIDVNENLDVVVHIHGGGFMLGSPSLVAGPDYIMDKDVVYVSFNYRLAVFGFLSTEDDTVPGNNGLKDQTLALQWIRDNIMYFGGNPDSVTLTGLSAGGASVHYHYLSPLSRGLFHRGFSQSGTALSSWALIKSPLKRAIVIGNHFQCQTNSTKVMIDCLRKVNAKDLVSSMKEMFLFMDVFPFTLFGPVVEKGNRPFLPEHPYKLLDEGKVYDVPWVSSNVKDEGIYPTAYIVLMQKLEELDSKWNEIMPYALDIQDTVETNAIQDVVTEIRKFYFEGEPLSRDNAYSLVQLFSDRYFLVDGEKAVRAHAKAVKSPVYYYFFMYLLQQPFLIPGFRKGKLTIFYQ
ncbi:hypothetical protein JTB14_036178 [Gonioctena quinquepunctata]|nr:hypothetical protein JTB14_036178 [Gonioctena quinquepunctata]